MADEDEVRAIDVIDRESGLRGVGHAVEVRVEEDDDIVDGEAERRAAGPVERGGHESCHTPG